MDEPFLQVTGLEKVIFDRIRLVETSTICYSSNIHHNGESKKMNGGLMSDIREIFATVRTYCGMMFGDEKAARQLGGEAAKRNCYFEKQQLLSIVIPSDSEGIQPINNSITLQGKKNSLTEKNLFPLKRAAFTLAEVLITLGIIGVVAALTLPTLIQNHQKQVYVTQLKKAYSTLGNAFNKMAVDEDVVDWKQTNCGSSLSPATCMEALTKQMNIIKQKDDSTCSAAWSDGFCDYAFMTNDGTLFLFSCANVAQLLVDVNGAQKSPNQYGRDRFAFYVDYEHNKIIPYGTEEMMYVGETVPEWSDCDIEDGYLKALSCTAKVIIEGKMNY